MESDNNTSKTKYESLRIRILRNETSIAQTEEWILNYSDQQIFKTIMHLNEDLSWIPKNKMSELNCHMYGICLKPLAHASPCYVDAEDLELLSECLDGYFNTLLSVSDEIHNKINWTYAQKNHQIKEDDLCYLLSERAIRDVMDIVLGWMEILKL